MRLVMSLLMLSAISCGRADDKNAGRKDEVEQPGKTELTETPKDTACTVSLAFKVDGISDVFTDYFAQHAMYDVSEVSSGCKELEGRDGKELSMAIDVAAVPSDGYLYSLNLDLYRVRFLPGVLLKDGNVKAFDIGSKNWDGPVTTFKGVYAAFGYPKRVEKSVYPQKVTVIITPRT